MFDLFRPPAETPSFHRRSRVYRGLASIWSWGEAVPTQSQRPWPRGQHTRLFFYRSRSYTGRESVLRALMVLHPYLYQRHHSDRQLWYMLNWDWFAARLRGFYGDWPEEPLAPWFRKWLVAELLDLGYEVQWPLPPQTHNTVLITWRAALYFNN